MIASSGLYIFFSGFKTPSFVSNSLDYAEKSLARWGFSLNHIIVDGRIRTSHEDLIKALALKRGDFIFKIDLPVLLKRLEKLPWIHNARLERRLPDTLFIKLVEKQPIGFWQQKKHFFLVDRTGTVIGEFSLKEFPGYVVATGQEAPRALPHLIHTLRNYPGIYTKTTGALYISKRRWDIILENKLRIQLPEGEIDQALAKVAELEAENRLNTEDLQAIDLRTKDRIYFYLSKEGLEKKQKETPRKDA